MSAPAPARDRRVRRSRAALIQAAIDVVTGRDTASVALSDIAEAAGVTRKVAYQQFGDRDALLMEAALDLMRREVVPQVINLPPGKPRALAALRHFADHRRFYRAVLTGPNAVSLGAGLADLVLPRTRDRIRDLHGDDLDPQLVADLAVQINGGILAMITAWLIEGDDPLDPDDFAERMLRVQYFLIPEGRRDADEGRR